MSHWLVIAELDWVEIENDDRLHAVRDMDDPADVVDDAWGGTGITECGLHADLRIPGMFTRMSAPRCPDCCRETGMPPGDQSPKNIKACRPVAAERARIREDLTA